MRPWKWADFPDVMQVGHIAKVLDCSHACARELCRDGRIRAVKVGQKWLAAKENVRAFLEGAGNGESKSDAA